MDDVISAGVLRGCPFGGVAIFVKNSICSGVKLICKNSRFIIIMIGDTVLINVYLPCAGSDNWDDEYVDCLALIANKLSELNYNNIIFGGDLNIDFTSAHPLHSCVLEFLKDLDLRLLDDLLPADSVTFHVEASGASSFIDHFAVTQQLYGANLSCE